MPGKYLILFSYNILVDGTKRSAIYSLHKGRVHLIPITLSEILKELEVTEFSKVKKRYSKQSKVFSQYIDFLTKENLIHYTDNPELFPKMQLNYERPELINNAIVEFEGNYDFQNLILSLNKLNCKALELKINPLKISYRILSTILSETCSSTLRFISLILLENSYTQKELEMVILKNKKLGQIIILNSPVLKNEIFDNCEIKYINLKEEDLINRDKSTDRTIFNINYFLESQSYNPYFNQKVSITSMGDIKNCLSLQTVFGNINKDDLLSIVILPEFKKLWFSKPDSYFEQENFESRYCIFSNNISFKEAI